MEMKIRCGRWWEFDEVFKLFSIHR